MICGSDEASTSAFTEINDGMDAKSQFIKHWFSRNSLFKHALSYLLIKGLYCCKL